MRFAIPLLPLAALLLVPAGAPASDLRFFEDASLRGVQFVGDTEAWAVGDEGVLLHTIDGGKTWERVPSGTRGSLRSVCFITPHFGWVAGREELPQGTSTGIILYTTDGGVKWHRVLTNCLPGLNRVRFIDPKTGFLMGDGTDQNPSGLFKTTDGGRSWKAVPGPRATSWFDGDFTDGEVGALGGSWSKLAKLRLGQITAADVDSLGGRTVRGLRLAEERGLAIGDGGLILLSKSKGAGWGFAPLKLPPDVLANVDFHGIDSIGENVWVVGRPGSILLHSTDGGLTWEVQKTNQPLPLYSIYFRDEQHGLAVGALGTILATSDGGRNWKVQRQGGQRAAMLSVHADGSAVPLETIAQLGLDEGFLISGLRVVGAEARSASPALAADEQRFSAALRLAGGAGGEMLWQFPLPQHLRSASKKQVVTYWDSLHGNQAGKQLLRQLVLALRIWKPEVIVTDCPEAEPAEPQAGVLLAEAMIQAVKMAADPQAFPEQLQYLFLEPWQVKKVYALWDKKNTAHVLLNVNDLKDRLQASPREYVHPAAALLALVPELPGQRYFRLLDSQVPGAEAQQRIMAGVESGASKGARRKLPPDVEIDPELLKTLKAKRQLQILAENPAQGLAKPDQIMSQLKPILNKLPQEQGAAAALALANHYVRSGQWLLAQEVFLLMAEQFPAHPQTAHAYRWLIQHNTSSEAQRRIELGQFVARSSTKAILPKVAPAEKVQELLEKQAQIKESEKSKESSATGKNKTHESKSTDNVPKIDWTELFQPGRLATQGQAAYLTNQAEVVSRYKSSLEFAERLKQFGVLHADDPAMQFCLHAAHRNMGEFKKAYDWYSSQKGTLAAGPWQKAAAAEYWLTSPQGPPPKPVLQCRPAVSRPYLDGEFNDPCWQNIEPVVLEDAVNKTGKEHKTEVRLTHDQEFLYLALSCTHPPEYHVAPVKGRKRNEDLRPFDRVSLMLDLDRDYATYYHLQIDQRGCVREDCWGDLSWNPKWFVAVRSNNTSWHIEAAIPLGELTGKPVSAGTVWACNVIRILPQRGVQAMSLPADVEPRPEGMGLLLFHQNPPPQIQPAAHIMPPAP